MDMALGSRSSPAHGQQLGEMSPARAFTDAETCRIAPLTHHPSPTLAGGEKGIEGL
jgi:hypothetical protein